MNKYVIDANIAIKWVINEVYTDISLRLLDDDRNILLIPDFFFPEITNILWKKVRKGEITLKQAQEMLNELKKVNLQISESYPLMSNALNIAVRIQQAVYDCVYLSLAIKNNCQMVTADNRFVNALKGDELYNYVCWVEDLPVIN